MTMPRRMTSTIASRVLLFTAAGRTLGVPIEDLQRVVPQGPLLPLPLAHPALVGVIRTMDGLCPVYDLGLWVCGDRSVGELDDVHSERMVALFSHPDGAVGIRLEQLGGMAINVTASPPDEETQELMNLEPALRALVQGIGVAGGRRFFFFSTDAFLAAVTAPV